ncbi:RBBP9/YdeN family alpha/beta hydrolase [Caballeronia ptereochthonis]|jgi:predicted alpha/beta hydrolase family esterase|uniref:Alpha/beta hydrolase n=1 Tax=Caballeronia ptereochthonis TaxID=1777144 RepID=A0A158B800_9BURK|nr:alpha/beta hydrolase [Caballeronia ptereochthonis]SAK66214.1 alpha/beta hydrolase [Caballeronia ptereochthonis]
MNATFHEAAILMVPGLRDHVEDHWQTHFAETHANVRTVPPLQRDKLDRAARVAALDAELAQIEGPVVLVAHSAGVMITAHWALRQRRKIRGALLVTPPDFDAPLPEGYPTLDELRLHGWLPTPRERLPFPCVVAASRNDPLARFERVADMARDWGARLHDLGEVGHMNPASGFGEWREAERLIAAID